MSDKLTDKLAVVTGASSGIGRAIAADLVARGCRVLAVARSIDKLTELRRELGERVIPVAVDICSEDSVGEFCDWATSEFERIDYLINNAGVGHMDAFLDTEPGQWRAAVDTNLYGALFLIRALLPGMLAARSGVVVNVGSSAASGWPYMTLYAASKAAILAATQSIDREIAGSGVRVISVEVGPTSNTDFSAHFNRAKIDHATRAWKEMGLPFDRPITPEASAQSVIAALVEAVGA